MYTIISIVT